MHNDYLTRASAWLKETQTSTAIVDAHNGLVRRVTAGKAKPEEVQDALDLLAEALIDQDGDPFSWIHSPPLLDPIAALAAALMHQPSGSIQQHQWFISPMNRSCSGSMS